MPTYMTHTKDPNLGASSWSTPVLINSSNLGIGPSVDKNFAPLILKNGSLLASAATRTRRSSSRRTGRTPRVTAKYRPQTFRGGVGPFNVAGSENGNFHIITHAECGKESFSSNARDWYIAPRYSTGTGTSIGTICSHLSALAGSCVHSQTCTYPTIRMSSVKLLFLPVTNTVHCAHTMVPPVALPLAPS